MPNRKHSVVTLRDVAEDVGVSTMTVSRALSAKAHMVRPEIVQKCREAAERLGYVPNLMARSLRGERLQTIVLFARNLSSHHYLGELTEAVAGAIEERRFGVISCQSVVSFEQAMLNFQLAGAVVIAPPGSFIQGLSDRAKKTRPVSHGDQEEQSGLDRQPTVIIHCAVEQHRYHEVSPAFTAMSYNAACHLIELGHRHLAYLGGPRIDEEHQWFTLRRQGIEQALLEHGLPPSNIRHQPCPDVDLAPAALQQLLARTPETTAIICVNDEQAVAAIDAAGKMGLRVPTHLSVVGCNNIRLAGFFRPALTTFALDIRAMVETSLNLLFEEIRRREGSAGKAVEPVRIRIPASLIVRESTGPPPG